MSTLCYSVRVKSICSISERAYKIKTFDGSEDIFPKSCVFGQDFEVIKNDAYWIAAWMLEKKNIQYSTKKAAWFDSLGRMLRVTFHNAEKKQAVISNEIEELRK